MFVFLPPSNLPQLIIINRQILYIVPRSTYGNYDVKNTRMEEMTDLEDSNPSFRRHGIHLLKEPNLDVK